MSAASVSSQCVRLFQSNPMPAASPFFTFATHDHHPPILHHFQGCTTKSAKPHVDNNARRNHFAHDMFGPGLISQGSLCCDNALHNSDLADFPGSGQQSL
eukprot:622424-Amphidinium_carterae.1